VGDKVRILTFDEPTLSGEFAVNADGGISFPLIGNVPALGRHSAQVADEITHRLAAGYLKSPKVSIEVVTFRPVYVLGEVNKPGEYPYAPGMTALTAVATAQGFTYRADDRHVYIRHGDQSSQAELPLTTTVKIEPGDLIRIGERYF